MVCLPLVSLARSLTTGLTHSRPLQIAVLQENCEVVCCVGSSLNSANCGAFTQADVSIAIDPSVSVQQVRA